MTRANVVPISTNPSNFTGAQIKLIKDTVAKDCNQQEFDLFVTVARNAGLDPFRKQISAIVFSKDDATKRRMSIITTIDGLRVIAARSRRYRPDEDEPVFEYDPALKGPDNPLGLVKAVVKIYIADDRKEGGWRPVTGVAYWTEFAALKEEVEGGFDWVDTGEVWPDSGKPKKRKVPKNAGAAVVPTAEGNWAKMGRVMLAKCAEAQALRKAFPEDLSGLYEGAELERAQVAELSPSEMIGQFDTEARLAKVGAINGITFQLFPNGPLESIPIGRVADTVIDTVRGFGSIEQLRWFESANTHPLREFWARSTTDALEVKKFIDEQREAILAQPTDGEADA